MKSILVLASLAWVATAAPQRGIFDTIDDLTELREEGLAGLKTGWDACEDTSIPCTLISVSEDRQLYGDIEPRTVADGLWEHCEATACFGDYYRESRTVPGFGSVSPGELKVTAEGDFTDENRWAIIFAMTEIMGRTTSRGELVDDSNARLGKQTLHVNYAPARLHVARYRWSESDQFWNRESELSISVGLEGSPKDTCATILGQLAAAAGAINGVVGSTLGLVSPACNSLPSHN